MTPFASFCILIILYKIKVIYSSSYCFDIWIAWSNEFIWSKFYYSQTLCHDLVIDSWGFNYVSLANLISLAIAMVDYCHYFHAYHNAYHYPMLYPPLATMVRKWKGLESDEAWKDYVDQVCTSQIFLTSSMLMFLFRLLPMKGLSQCLLRTSTTESLILIADDMCHWID